MRGIEAAQTGQQQRNKELLGGVRYLGEKVHSEVLRSPWISATNKRCSKSKSTP